MPYSISDIRTVQVTRYITPLREGGSMPAIAEADDGFMYALKFRGAGQGVKALIADLIGAEVARVLGLRVPEVVFAILDEAFGRTEPDEEIQDLLKASTGLNLALHYLSGAITYDPTVFKVDPLQASQIVWLDCFITNMDRTVRNTNMLYWHQELWLIDHGAALYFHHTWNGWEAAAVKPFALVKDHVLLPQASHLEEVDAAFRALLTPAHLEAIVAAIPDSWLCVDAPFATPEEHRQAYAAFLKTRLAHSNIFVNAALMQDKHLFEYAVLRVVPRVEREEFVNAGVILFCPKQRFLRVAISLDEARMLALFPDADVAAVCAHLESFRRICEGGTDGGPIGLLDLASRFRWLTAVRSTVVQTSRVHPGFCGDAGAALEALFEQMAG